MELGNISNRELRLALKASATLDIEVCDEEFLRCFTYTENWAPGFDVATYENGGGDDIIFVIQGDSILIKGFDHESEVSPHAQDEYGVWPGMYEGAPHDLLSVLDDDTFEVEDVTFCYWRLEIGDWRTRSLGLEVLLHLKTMKMMVQAGCYLLSQSLRRSLLNTSKAITKAIIPE